MADAEDPQGGSARSGSLGPWGLGAVVLGLAVLGGALLMSREQELMIVVVSLDTTRSDHLSAYGHERPTTPTLDRLAREGALFRNARSTTSWTLPSHMSLFTGLPPDLHNVVIDFHRLDAGRKTMGEVFKAADYRTIGLYSAPYVHKRFGFDRGMDFYESVTRNPMAYDLAPEQMDRQMAKHEKLSHLEVTSDFVSGKAMWFLKTRARPRNFLFLHYFDPHYDYLPSPRAKAAMVEPGYNGPVTGTNVTVDPAVHRGMADVDLEHLRQLYDAEILWTDANLAELVKFLEEQGYIGKTIVVITADHGEEFFEHGRFGHRMGLYDEVLRVPLIVWGPGIIAEGQVIDDDVALYDVLPTLMDYAGLEQDPEIYGRSLRPLIEGGSLPPRPSTAALTFLHRPGPSGPLPYYTRHDAVVYEGMKYLRRLRIPWSTDDPLTLNNEPLMDSLEHEAYDLVADPGEQYDLFVHAPDDPRLAEIQQVFARESAQQKQTLAGMLNLGAPPLENDSLRGRDPFEAMQAVGYLGQEEEGDEAAPSEPAADGGNADSGSTGPDTGDDEER